MAWTKVQSPTLASGTTTLTLTCAATTAHNFLVACMMSPAGATPIIPPSGQLPSGTTTGWRLASSHSTADGRVEQWYWFDVPAGVTSCAFNVGTGNTARGSISEHTPPAGTVGVFVDAVARKSGTTTGTSMSGLNANCAHTPGDLGILTVGDFFAANPVSPAWVFPTGYSVLAQINTSTTKCFMASANENLAAGTIAQTTGLTTSSTSTSWCAVSVAYRAVHWAFTRYEGAEPCSAFDISPDGRQLIIGGNVWGHFRYFPGAHQAQPSSTNILGTKGNQSPVGYLWPPAGWGEVNALGQSYVYSATGKSASEPGGFLASADGGVTWTQRSTSRSWMIIASSPPLPTNVGGHENDQAVGQVLAADVGNNLIYTVDFGGDSGQGVYRSADYGATWTQIGTPGLYLRSILINPNNASEAWVGGWDATTTTPAPAGSANGGVWHTTNLLTAGVPTDPASVTWTRLSGFTGTAAQMVFLDTGANAYLYVTCDLDGLYRSAAGTGTLTAMNGTGSTYGGGGMTALDTTGSSDWTAIDGYVSGGNHVLIVGCSRGKKPSTNYTAIIKVVCTPGGTPALTDLTGPNPINTATLPDGRPWWHYNWSWQFWLGGNNSTVIQIMVDPTDATHNTIYASCAGGFFRSDDGGATWYIEVAGMPAFNVGAVAWCPICTEHLITGGSDFAALEFKNSGGTAGAVSGADATAINACALPHDAGTTAESHWVAFDPVSGDICQTTNAGYSQNTHGRVSYRFHADPVTTWHDCGYQAAVVPNNSPMGVITGRLADGTTRYLVVAVQSGGGAGGLYRALSTDGGITWSWTGTGKGQVNTEVGSSGHVAQTVPMIRNPLDASRLWAFDRKRGLYRSADYGVTWTRVWNTTLPLGGKVTDGTSGRMAFNPDVAGELWVTASDGLWRLTNTGSGTVEGGQITAVKPGSGQFAGGAAGVAFYNHVMYAASLANGAGTPSPKLWSCTNPSAASPTFSDAGSAELAAYLPRPHAIEVNPSGAAVIPGTEDLFVWTYLAATAPVTITISPTTLPAGETTIAYASTTFTATGGTGPYTWAVTAGALPSGLALSGGGVLSGTPTADGAYTFTVTATDANGATGAAGYTVTIATVNITTTKLAAGNLGTAYSQTLTAASGVPPYGSWTVTAGALPTGLSLAASTGVISGTPTAAGTFPFTVQVADAAGVHDTAGLSITIGSSLSVATAGLDDAFVGVAYNFQLIASGGGGALVWTIIGGALPAGLSMTADGLISGIPTASGASAITFQVAAGGLTANALLTLTVLIPAPVLVPLDSLVLAGQFELLGNSEVPSDHPMCPGAFFRLDWGYDLGVAQPIVDIIAELSLDGERPYGRRAGNRTASLPIAILAPDRDTLAAAREAVLQAIDVDSFELIWTRAGGLPMIIDCFRASAATVSYDLVAEAEYVVKMTLTFTALPYGRSGDLETIQFSTASSGWTPPPPPVIVDDYSNVGSSTQSTTWTQATVAAQGAFSARWSRSWHDRPHYSRILTNPVDITGMTKVTFWAGLGTPDSQYSVWHRGDVVADVHLIDGSGTDLAATVTVRAHASADPETPKWTQFTVPLPDTTDFDFTSLTSYTIKLWNTSDENGNRIMQAETYLSDLHAATAAVGTAKVRGAVYSLRGVIGTARAPLALAIQPGLSTARKTKMRSTAGTSTWTPAADTVATLEGGGAGGGGGGGTGGPFGGAGGAGGEYASWPDYLIPGGSVVSYTAGTAGTAGAANAAGGAGTDSVITVGGVEILRAHAGPGGAAGSGQVTAKGGHGSKAPVHFPGGDGGPPQKAAGQHWEGSGGGGSGGPFSPGRAGGVPFKNPATGNYRPGSGGAAVDGGGPGGTGGVIDHPAGRGPAVGWGGGGGGGYQSSAAGPGWAGWTQITYGSQVIAPMTALIVHRASDGAPDTLNPLIPVDDGSPPDGTTEYIPDSPIDGANARYAGTYSVVLVANTWHSPATARLVTVTVNQYDAQAGRMSSASASALVTPNTLTQNNIVRLGQVTLPVRDLAPDQTEAYFSVTPTSADVADSFLDVLLLDSEGSTLIMDTNGVGFNNVWIDAPVPERALGQILGSALDRSSASSILSSVTTLSGPPLNAPPGDSWLLVYCPAGAPGATASYLPRWRVDRLA